MNNDPIDPILALLLKGLKDPAQREAIITAYKTLLGSGATTLPGALGILLARLVEIVAGLAETVSPSAQHQKEIAELRQKELPKVEEAKETMVQTSLSIRRLRMTYIVVWILSAMVVAAGAAGYGVYHYTALTPQQKTYLSIGEQMQRPLTSAEIDWLNLGITMSQHGIYVRPADPESGNFGLVFGAKTPWLKGHYVKDANNQPVAVEIHWQDNGEAQ